MADTKKKIILGLLPKLIIAIALGIVIMIIGWREQSTIRLFSLPNDTFGSE